MPDHVRCSRCGGRCSADVPVDRLVVRAYVECPECVEKDMAAQSLTPPYLRVREAARLLGVHENTIRNWCRDDVLRYRRLPGSGYLRILRDDVERLAAEKDPPEHAN